MKAAVDIIEEFINTFTFEGVIKSVIDNGGGSYTIEVCKTWHARNNTVISINGNNFTVTDFTNNESITGTTSVAPVQGETFIVSGPRYFHNTVKQQNDDLSAIKISSDKFPLIWVHENVRNTHNNRRNADVADRRKIEVRIFFLDASNWKAWSTDQHYSERIQPMLNLMQEFIDQVNKPNNKFFRRPESFTHITWPKFGSYFGGRDSQDQREQNVFNDETSGVELQIMLPFKNLVICKDNC